MAISKLVLNGEVQMDVTSDTVTAGSMLSGTTATKNDGTKATGTIASKSSTDMTVSGATVTAPAGYYANAASKAVATTTHPNPSASITSSTGVVTASHTQGTGYVTGGTTTGTLNLTTQAGKTVTPTESAQTAVASYRWTTGNVNVAAISSTYVGTGVTTRSSANLTASGSVVTAPAGYYSTAATKSIAAGSAFSPAVTITKAPTIGVNTSGVVTASYNGSSSITPTVTSGYISQGTAGTISTTGTSTYQLTSKAAATYYPSTADQTIASQRWLVGNQTIKSVTTSNLTAENIAEGVVVKVGDANNASRITQITGTHSGGGKHKVKIIQAGANGGSGVAYNDIPHYELNEEFYVTDGDTITIECAQGFNNNYIYVNGELVKSGTNGGTASYDLVVSSDINVKLGNSYNPTGYVYVYEYVIPAGTLSITSNGTYNVYGYSSASVNADPSPSTFNVKLNGFASSVWSIRYQSSYWTTPYKSYTMNAGDSITVFNNSNLDLPLRYDYYIVGTISAGSSFDMPLGPIVMNIEAYSTSFSVTMGYSNATSYIGDALYTHYWSSNISITVPERISLLGQGAFYSIDALQSISGNNVTLLGAHCFERCNKLTTVSFPKVLKIGGSCFAGCSKLTVVDFPETGLIGDGAFYSCSLLSSVNLPKALEIGSSCFRFCSQLTSVNFPLVSTVATGAFGDCEKLSTVIFPKIKIISAYAFQGCFSLVNIDLTNVTYIGASAFERCSALTHANIPNVSQVASSAFNNCRQLSIVSLSAVTSIYASAFASCYHLLSVYLFGSSVPAIASTTVFYATPISGYTTSTGGVYGSIFVPASLYNSYITAANWSIYSARIVSM